MKNTIQKGDVIVVEADGAIESGQLVKQGAFIGVAVKDAADGEDVAVSICGVYEVPKLSTDNMTQGAALYFDEAEGELTLDSDEGANALAGYAFEAAGASTTTVKVKLLF